MPLVALLILGRLMRRLLLMVGVVVVVPGGKVRALAVHRVRVQRGRTERVALGGAYERVEAPDAHDHLPVATVLGPHRQGLMEVVERNRVVWGRNKIQGKKRKKHIRLKAPMRACCSLCLFVPSPVSVFVSLSLSVSLSVDQSSTGPYGTLPNI